MKKEAQEKLDVEMKKVFPKIRNFLTEDELVIFINTPANNLSRYNYKLGTMIRVKLLRRNSLLYRAFLACGIEELDDMAMMVIRQYHRGLQNK